MISGEAAIQPKVEYQDGLVPGFSSPAPPQSSPDLGTFRKLPLQ